jgi:hypothetical protein
MAHPVFASMPSRLNFSRPHHVQMKMPPHLLPTRQSRSLKQIRYSFHHKPNLDGMASPWDAPCLVTNLPSQYPRPSSCPSIANRRSAHTAHLSLPSAPRASHHSPIHPSAYSWKRSRSSLRIPQWLLGIGQSRDADCPMLLLATKTFGPCMKRNDSWFFLNRPQQFFPWRRAYKALLLSHDIPVF